MRVDAELQYRQSALAHAQHVLENSAESLDALLSDGRAMSGEVDALLDGLSRLTANVSIVAPVHALARRLSSAWHAFERRGLLCVIDIVIYPHIAMNWKKSRAERLVHQAVLRCLKAS